MMDDKEYELASIWKRNLKLIEDDIYSLIGDDFIQGRNAA